jgi:hypothetical protein
MSKVPFEMIGTEHKKEIKCMRIRVVNGKTFTEWNIKFQVGAYGAGTCTCTVALRVLTLVP